MASTRELLDTRNIRKMEKKIDIPHKMKTRQQWFPSCTSYVLAYKPNHTPWGNIYTCIYIYIWCYIPQPTILAPGSGHTIS